MDNFQAEAYDQLESIREYERSEERLSNQFDHPKE